MFVQVVYIVLVTLNVLYNILIAIVNVLEIAENWWRIQFYIHRPKNSITLKHIGSFSAKSVKYEEYGKLRKVFEASEKAIYPYLSNLLLIVSVMGVVKRSPLLHLPLILFYVSVSDH